MPLATIDVPSNSDESSSDGDWDNHDERMDEFIDATVDAIIDSIVDKPTPRPFHDSSLSGSARLRELRCGHPDAMRAILGVTHTVFASVLGELQIYAGLSRTKHVESDEQLAIFLYIARGGLSVRHAGMWFQRSNGTIAK